VLEIQFRSELQPICEIITNAENQR
jgi:hypothetical protein